MAFDLFEDDNFHFMDEDERDLVGTFASYDEAVEVAKQRVEKWLRDHLVHGMTSDQLLDEYQSFGCDPFIRPGNFSAWTYAAEIIPKLTNHAWRPSEAWNAPVTEKERLTAPSVGESGAVDPSGDSMSVDTGKPSTLAPSPKKLPIRSPGLLDETVTTRFADASTLYWSAREGDHVLWVRCINLFATGESAFRILDFWELHDGDRVTITNQVANLPAGFELHPTEVQDALCYEMMRRLDAGWQPGPIVDGPELWRVRSGDRLVWTGESHADRVACNHVVELVDFAENALASGCSTVPRQFLEIFGAPTKDEATQQDTQQLRAGFLAAVGQGTPRTVALDWALG